MIESRWSVEKAQQWYAAQHWLVGCNFIPSTAINQLEMWQADSFDPETIVRELGWAQNLGFNSVRVFLHDLLWLQDAQGFCDRIRRYLDIAGQHQISTLFVLFDDCWNDHPRLGRQPDPAPGLHNSGWVRSPGMKAIRDEQHWDRLEEYVTGVVSAFGQDERVLLWDLYNEPGNDFLISPKLPRLVQIATLISLRTRYLVLPVPAAKLLQKTFSWARQAAPRQPLTTAVWYLTSRLENRLNRAAFELSDVITFHSYSDLEVTRGIFSQLQTAGRPVICTEYLARGGGSNFKSHLPFFKEHKIGAYNWGLVAGKIQTYYSWGDYYPAGEEPPLWHHDILRRDGSPYRQEEVDLIQQITQFNR
jgi:hypothetical protein